MIDTRIIVAGGRDFGSSPDHNLVMECVFEDMFWLPLDDRLDTDITLICGMAKGADMMAHAYAQRAGWSIEEFPADWEQHGKAAGPIRNELMANMSPQMLIAFWDGKSKGTKHMIDTAFKRQIETHVYFY